jgi:hypothetical protein
MKTKSHFYACLTSAVLLGLVCTAKGISTTTIIQLGPAAPPSTLGGFSMTAFGPDASPDGTMVSSAGSLSFNQAVRHDSVPFSWSTWSHGYAGNVYDTGSSLDPTTLILIMAQPVLAFDFYVEPVNFGNFTFTATAQDGTTSSQVVNGSGGASGFGFFSSGLNLISSITVTTTDSDGFAIGEFGVNGNASVPEGGSSFGYLSLILVLMWVFRFVVRRNEAKA